MRRAGEGHGRAVGRDGRQFQVGVGVIGDGGPLRGGQVYADHGATDGRTGRGVMPRRHDEAAIGADVEVRLPQRIPGLRGEVAWSVEVEQMRVVGPEVVIPVTHRISAVQHR